MSGVPSLRYNTRRRRRQHPAVRPATCPTISPTTSPPYNHDHAAAFRNAVCRCRWIGERTRPPHVATVDSARCVPRMPACLRACVPACLACLACLRACVPACLRAWRACVRATGHGVQYGRCNTLIEVVFFKSLNQNVPACGRGCVAAATWLARRNLF